MSRIEEMSRQLLWITSHILFTLIAACAVRGAYQFYQDWKLLEGKSINLSELTVEEKNALLEALIDEPGIPKAGKK